MSLRTLTWKGIHQLHVGAECSEVASCSPVWLIWPGNLENGFAFTLMFSFCMHTIGTYSNLSLIILKLPFPLVVKQVNVLVLTVQYQEVKEDPTKECKVRLVSV